MICIGVILSSLPTLFAFNYLDQVKLKVALAKQKPIVEAITDADTKLSTAVEAFFSRHEELEKIEAEMREELMNGYISKEYYLSELKKMQDEDDENRAEVVTYREKWFKLKNEIIESESNYPPEILYGYEVKTLGISVDIYLDWGRNLRAKKNGDDSLTGHMVWPAAQELAMYIDESCRKDSWIRGRKIVELGAGTGYLSIVAACLGGDVIATDLPPMIPFIQKNIVKNCKHLEKTEGRIRTQILRWGDMEAAKSIPTPDIILLSDLIYEEIKMDIESLVSTMVALADETTILFMVQEKRLPSPCWETFYSQASEYFKFSPAPNYDHEKFWLFQGTLK